MSKALVSIIIPAYNEAKHIGACLQSLVGQWYKPLEIIVVDDGSTDKTRSIVAAFPGVQLLKQSHLGAGAARNLGVKQSKGSILVFVDADMTFDFHFIDRLTQPIRQGSQVGTFSKEEFVANSDNPWARSWSYLRGFADGRMHPADFPDQQPVFRAIAREAFESVSGFDSQRGYDDDWSVSEKLGIQAQAAPGAVFYHNNPASLREIGEQSRWMAKRRYKAGLLGELLSVLRSSVVMSLPLALFLGIRYRSPHVLAAKLVADWSSLAGMIEKWQGKVSR